MALTRGSATFSLEEARRIALAAQGLGQPRGHEPSSQRDLHRLVQRLGVLQIDSVNIIARAHTLPGFSRLGPYATADIDALAYGGRKRKLFEYWGHEASYLPVEIQPLFRWRMQRAAAGQGLYSGLARFGRERADFIAAVLAEVAARGPVAASEVSMKQRGKGSWWGWSEAKTALEWLFWAGELTTASRRGAFERIYDLTGRVLPRAVLATPTPSAADAQRELMRISAAAHGIGTEPCLRDYFRLDPAESKARVADLVEAGELIPVSVRGWGKPAYLWHKARVPRQIEACALLAPFDPLVWQRERTEALFGARIRLEIYTPAHKRIHGYYVLPFVLGTRVVARVDLKADRQNRTLRVLATHSEPDSEASRTPEPLAAELSLMAHWLGLERIEVMPRGDMAAALARVVVGHTL